jgi:hypothetical protein
LKNKMLMKAGTTIMDVNRILSELDAEIKHLETIREALKGLGGTTAAEKSKGKLGRPKGSTNAVKATAVKTTAAKATPVKTAPAKVAPVKVAPAKVAPVKAAAVTATGGTAAVKTTRRRKLSPEGRKKIAEAMKRRWATYRKTNS